MRFWRRSEQVRDRSALSPAVAIQTKTTSQLVRIELDGRDVAQLLNASRSSRRRRQGCHTVKKPDSSF